MKNRILAALLALVLGVPLYLLAADAAPTAAAKTVSSAAPAQAVALLKALPSVEDLAAAMTPEADAAAMIAQTRADLQREIERQTIVTKSNVERKSCYELAHEAKAHFVCDVCHKITDFAMPKVAKAQVKSVIAHGICNECK